MQSPKHSFLGGSINGRVEVSLNSHVIERFKADMTKDNAGRFK